MASSGGGCIVPCGRGGSTADIDLECWFCAAPFDRAKILGDGMLVPRRAADGGPFYRYACPSCGRPSHAERNRAGALLCSPPPIVPVADALLATFDPDARRELAAKRHHERRRAGRREWFFGPYADELIERGWRPGDPADDVRRAAGRAAGPRRARADAGSRPPPGDPPPPPPPGDPPPATTPSEPSPHELLGVAPDATPEQVNAAFRELAKRYHPDRFAALDEEFQALATRRMQQLMAAREAMLGSSGATPPD